MSMVNVCLRSKKIFLSLSLSIFTPIFSVDQGIIVKNVYHHQGATHQGATYRGTTHQGATYRGTTCRGASGINNNLELGSVVFYFSGKPVIQKISSEITSGAVQKNTYSIKGARLNAEKMATLPIINKYYTVAMRNVGDDVHLVVTYDAHRVASEFDTFDSISLQKGVIIHFLNRMQCGVQQPMTPLGKKKNRQKTIVIDCGHGGSDAGAIGPCGIKEKDIVLRIGLQVAQLLQKAHMRVLFTRSSDVDVPLDARTSYANQQNADLFVSIHANASTNTSAQGIDTFCMQPSLLHTESLLSDGACGNRLRELLKMRADESNRLARSVHQSVITKVKKQYPTVVDRKVKYEVGQILLGSHMPAILIEVGFVSHEQEAKRLRDGAYQYLLAACISDGIIAYLKE